MRKRLEHIRTMRDKVSRFSAATPHRAAMGLAQLLQEKDRLMQERKTWEKRIGKIDERLREIAETEKWLSAAAQLNLNGKDESVDIPEGLPPGFTEIKVKY